jgi:glycosyltransferase involved in cell wall biosynthesis
MNNLVITSNQFNEIDEAPEWLEMVKKITNNIIIVDSGSDDGTIEFYERNNVTIIVDDIIRREGYGPARNHLRELSKRFYPDAKWMIFLDADERINENEFHQLRFIADYLIAEYDVVGFPRIDWHDREMTHAENDWRVSPDWQARMTKLNSKLKYVRKIHEQITDFNKIYTVLTNPKINHLHRPSSQEKRDRVGKLCAKLHKEDAVYGATVPKHHKEDMYYERYLKEGI